MSIEDRVKRVIAEQFGVDPTTITDDSNLAADHGADSLDQVEIGMGLEDEFGFEIPDEQMTTFKTPREIAEYVRGKVPA
jgi:acyl carrier protein